MSQVEESEAAYAEVSSAPMAKEKFDMEENKCYGGVKAASRKNAPAGVGSRSIVVALTVVMALVTMLIIAVAASCIVLVREMAELKTATVPAEQERGIATLQNTLENFSSSVDTRFQQLLEDHKRINGKMQQFNLTLEKIVTILILHADNKTQQYYTELQNITFDTCTSLLRPGKNEILPAPSCAALPPSSPSGYYWVRASNGSAVRVYCDMTRSCGGVTGGWMRVAELDMTNSSHQCPRGLSQRNHSKPRTCVRDIDLPGCSSILYSTASLSYSRVCGRVIAYQENTTNAFRVRGLPISSAYVDGVSITHGDPKEHVWTFASALAENVPNTTLSGSGCSCIGNSGFHPPGFVSNDYFCDTGLKTFNASIPLGVLGADPLWDGEGCEPPNDCCSFNNPPWFHKQLPQPTTDDIEMRVCRDEPASEEDIAIEVVDIYIQ